jgi:hypothetical protein
VLNWGFLVITGRGCKAVGLLVWVGNEFADYRDWTEDEDKLY